MHPALSDIQRINIVGTSGTGKTTFARRLAAKINAPYIEMDKIFWGPNWTESTDEVFRGKLTTALDTDSWILDGNYTRTTPVKWKNVQMVIWLDYSFRVVMFRAITRALHRIISQHELWEGTGNRESFSKLFGKQSIVRWTYNTYDHNIRKYESMMADETFKHITFIRIKTPGEAKQYLNNLKTQI